jgi:hypothetical protein
MWCLYLQPSILLPITIHYFLLCGVCTLYYYQLVFITSYYVVFAHYITTNYFSLLPIMWGLYLQPSQELCNMQRLQHGMHINFAPHVPPEAHHVSVEGLLPLECTPANAVSAATAKIVGNLAPPSCTSPNVCLDPAGHAPSRCISFQRLRLNPEPVSIQGIRYPLARLYRLIRPVVIYNPWSSSSIPAV